MTPTLRACAFGLAVLTTTISATWAAGETVALRLGAGSSLALERPFDTVLIADPEIVDVHTRGDRAVMIEPLKPGATNLVFIDGESIAIANVRVLVCNAGAVRINYQDQPGCEQADARP